MRMGVIMEVNVRESECERVNECDSENGCGNGSECEGE